MKQSLIDYLYAVKTPQSPMLLTSLPLIVLVSSSHAEGSAITVVAVKHATVSLSRRQNLEGFLVGFRHRREQGHGTIATNAHVIEAGFRQSTQSPAELLKSLKANHHGGVRCATKTEFP